MTVAIIHSNTEEPGGKERFVAETAYMPENPDKDLLRAVGRFVFIAQVTAAVIEDAILVLFEQHFKGLPVMMILEGFDKGGVRIMNRAIHLLLQ